MPIHGFFTGAHPAFLLEVMSAQKAEVIVWVDVVQRQDEVDQGLPTVMSMSYKASVQ